MKAKDNSVEGRIDELRARLDKLDAERSAVAAELHRLTDPESLTGPPPGVQKDPIPESGHKDWHIFAGPAKQKTIKPKIVPKFVD